MKIYDIDGYERLNCDDFKKHFINKFRVLFIHIN